QFVIRPALELSLFRPGSAMLQLNEHAPSVFRQDECRALGLAGYQTRIHGLAVVGSPEWDGSLAFSILEDTPIQPASQSRNGAPGVFRQSGPSEHFDLIAALVYRHDNQHEMAVDKTGRHTMANVLGAYFNDQASLVVRGLEGS